MANGRKQVVDVSGALAGMDRLVQIVEPVARAMGSAMGGSVRDEAKLRAPILKPENVGTDNQQPGVLQRAIYQAFDERAHVLNPAQYKYNVSWNSKVAPHGHLIEFGHKMPFQYDITGDGRYFTPKPEQAQVKQIFVAALPFLGPAFDAKQRTLLSIAVSAGSTKFGEVTQ